MSRTSIQRANQEASQTNEGLNFKSLQILDGCLLQKSIQAHRKRNKETNDLCYVTDCRDFNTTCKYTFAIDSLLSNCIFIFTIGVYINRKSTSSINRKVSSLWNKNTIVFL